MGMTFVEGGVSGPRGRKRRVRLLVDSGASYSVLPYKVWRGIGLSPRRSVSFTLADGTVITRPVSECQVELGDQQAHTPVVLGDPGDEALLGAVTLEVFGLVLNPLRRTFQPMQMRL